MNRSATLIAFAACAIASALAIQCSGFAGTSDDGDSNSDGGGDGSNQGDGASKKDGSVDTGTSATNDAGPDASEAGAGSTDASAPSCTKYLCDSNNMPTVPCPPSSDLRTVYQFGGQDGSHLAYCYSSSSTRGSTNCEPFSQQGPIAVFSLYSSAADGLVQIWDCGSEAELANNLLMLSDAGGNPCPSGANENAVALGYIAFGQSCGSQPLTELTDQVAATFWAYQDASPPASVYVPSNVVYQAWAP